MNVDEKTEEEKTESEKFADEVKSKLKLDMDENTKGIPEFWLTAMKNVELLGDMIQDHDEEILKHLTNVKLILLAKKTMKNLKWDLCWNFYFNSMNILQILL